MEFRTGNIDKLNKNLNNIIVRVAENSYEWTEEALSFVFFYPNANFILKFLKLVMKHKIVIVDTTMC